MCAPPRGSFMISSAIPISYKSFEDTLIASAASLDLEESLNNIEAHPSGEITENQVFCIHKILSANPIASAPPEAPSPITIEIIGTFNVVTGRSLSINEIGKIILSNTDFKVETYIPQNKRKNFNLIFDNSKLMNILPKFNFTPIEKGIKNYTDNI